MMRINTTNIPNNFWVILAAAVCIAALFIPMSITMLHADDVQVACIKEHGNWNGDKKQCTFTK